MERSDAMILPPKPAPRDEVADLKQVSCETRLDLVFAFIFYRLLCIRQLRCASPLSLSGRC